MGTSCRPSGSEATVEWVAEDLDGGAAQFTVINRHVITTDKTAEETTDLSVHWTVSFRGTLIARGASATLDGAQRVALAVTAGLSPVGR